MGQGVALTEWQVQSIRATWLLTGNGSEAARVAGCHAATANRYIASHREELAQIAQEKKPELADVVRSLLERVLSVAFDGKKLADASFGQIVTGIGILVDKHQLLTGKATVRTEQSNAFAHWSDDEVSSLAALAERVKTGDIVS